MTNKQLAKIEELRYSNKILLLVDDVVDVLGCQAQSIRDQAQRDPSKIGFPVFVWGAQVRVPRIPFLNALGIPAVMCELGSAND